MSHDLETEIRSGSDGPITSMNEIHAIDGTHPASREDFERLSGHLPSDDEG